MLNMQLCSGRILRYIALSLTFLSVFAASLIWYFCSSDVCTLERFHLLISNNTPSFSYWRKLKASRENLLNWKKDPVNSVNSNTSLAHDVSYDKLSVGQSEFDMHGSDVIVFLHIQNTGGSVFARHMIEDLALERPCRCKRNRRLCHCYRPNKYGSPWLFSRYTTGWKCGVHPDWSELSSCVDRVMDEEEGKPVKRRYFFITVLRDPVKRFLSEFWHTRQGQNWRSSRHWCSGTEATSDDLPSCFDENDLEELTLEQFMACPYNLAINRQTRMLSDLSLVGCYNSSSMPKEDRDLVMLASAKTNLHKMAFFGLSEFPKVSQYMFETTFDLNFVSKEQQFRGSFGRSARKELLKELGAKETEKIKHINDLDMELYRYAKELLFYRFEKLKNNDPGFENTFQTISKNKLSNEDWAEKEDFIDGPSK